MSGRHRKPSTSSIGVAKIAVTGAVIGGGSLGLAAQAQAATDSEWDIVASCESSGNWAINTGNGYQGGLQFSPSTWLGYGGGQFASAANMASREQQIAIAEKVLAGQGKGAWPVCGRGLSGPTPRTVTPTGTKTTHGQTPAAPADTPVDAPAPAAGQDAPVIPEQAPVPAENLPAPADAAPAPAGVPAPQDLGPVPAEGAPAPAPQDLPAPADAVPAPEGTPAPAPEGTPAPAPEGTPAPAPQDGVPAPAPEGTPAPAPQDGVPAPAPQDGVSPAPAPVTPAPGTPAPEIISIADTNASATVVQASMLIPAPLAPADPAVPPVAPTAPIVPPADAPAPAAASAVPAAAPGTPVTVVPASAPVAPAAATPATAVGPDGTVVAAAAPEGVPHLPSPDSPPPGTSTDPGQAGNPNVSYLKELWHALKDQEIDRNDLLLALAQRSFTSPVPVDGAAPEAAPVPVSPAG